MRNLWIGLVLVVLASVVLLSALSAPVSAGSMPGFCYGYTTAEVKQPFRCTVTWIPVRRWTPSLPVDYRPK